MLELDVSLEVEIETKLNPRLARRQRADLFEAIKLASLRAKATLKENTLRGQWTVDSMIDR